MKDLISTISSTKTVDDATSVLFSYVTKNELITKALNYTIKQHEGQKRKSGEPYVVHPILVATLSGFFCATHEVVVASLLHDVVEDTDANIEDIGKLFGEEIKCLVDGLTKIDHIREDNLIPSTSNEKLVKSALTFKNMLLTSVSDVRVLVIKLCDRVHNLLTLDALREEKQKRIAEESLVVYAPIAHKLGMHKIKNYIEDLSFKYLIPNEFQKIDNFLKSNHFQLQLRLNTFVQKILQLLLINGFLKGSFKLEKRVKHHYSIFTKMQRKGLSIDEVLDLLAIRVLVKEPVECYKVLGIAHQNFKPLFSRFKDYIAIPKENGYQTLHTTIFDENDIIEVQIRTFDMNNSAKFGLAAHWKYKSSALEPKLEWLQNLNSEDQNQNIQEFYDLVKSDLYVEQVQVFTPNGDAISLPLKATALDFAYAIHTDLGDKTKEVYINNKRQPLLTELKSGDILRVVSDEQIIYRCTWLDSVKTSRAKKAIIQNCKAKAKVINKKLLVNLLTHFFKTDEETIKKLLQEESVWKNTRKIVNDFNHYKATINLLKKHFSVMKKMLSTPKKQSFPNVEIYSNKKIKGTMFNYCCQPKRGDKIVAIYENNEAVIHHKLCSNVQELLKTHPALFAQWSNIEKFKYKIIAILENKVGSLASFLAFLAKMQLNLISVNHGVNKSTDDIDTDYFEIVIEISKDQFQKINEELSSRYKIAEFVCLNDAFN